MNDERPDEPTCEWCGATFERPSPRGPTPKYCCGAHRQAAHRARGRSAIDPDLLAGIMPKIDPKVFAALTPQIDPDLFAGIMPKIDPDLFAGIMPKIDPNVFAAFTPKIDPNVFAAFTPKIDPNVFTSLTFDESWMRDFEESMDTEVLDRLAQAIEDEEFDRVATEAPLDGETSATSEDSAAQLAARSQRRVVLVLLALIAFQVGSEVAAGAQYVAESLFTVWALQWQLANASPEGALAVVAANESLRRAVRWLGTPEIDQEAPSRHHSR